MNFKRGLNLINVAEAGEITQAAAESGYPLYLIDTERGSSREVFFEAVKASIPLDPPIHGSRSWEALADSLWEGLHAQHFDRVVILWPDASEMAEDSPREYATAIDVLSGSARNLADPNATVGHPTEVCIYVGTRQPQELSITEA
jgi:Barstar (barnase inhibitor)